MGQIFLLCHILLTPLAKSRFSEQPKMTLHELMIFLWKLRYHLKDYLPLFCSFIELAHLNFKVSLMATPSVVVKPQRIIIIERRKNSFCSLISFKLKINPTQKHKPSKKWICTNKTKKEGEGSYHQSLCKLHSYRLKTIINLYYAKDHYLVTDDMAVDDDLIQLPIAASQTATSSVVCT